MATLQNIKIEADALKVRCLNEITAEENKILERMAAEAAAAAAQAAQNADGSAQTDPVEDVPVTPVPVVKKKKTISIKSVNTASTWQLETADDVRRYVYELEKKLIDALEEDTVINVEF